MKNEQEPFSRLIQGLKLIVFASVLAAMCVLGLMTFLRPTESAVEKRTLTEFPPFTMKSLWDGSFFSGIDTWYADTYPLREQLIDAQQSMENHYGIRTTQIVGGSGMVADAIPVPGGDTAAGDAPAPDSGASAATDVPSATPVPTSAPTPVPTPEGTPLPDGTVRQPGEFSGSIYITQNSAFGTYYFSQGSADDYISTMNQIYQNIGDRVKMYVMNVPLSSAVMLDDAVIADMGASKEEDAIAYISAGLDPGITPISVCPILREHNAEYIYFRTDHHWTQLGAYYAYQAFCAAKGWSPHTLDQFRTRDFGANAYLGSYYTSSNKAAALAAHPDTVQAWYPMCVDADDSSQRDMYMVQRDGSAFDWRIINDMYDYPDSEWYCVFSAADQPFSSMHNPNIHDGSAIMVVKDSYGNAFVPWLVDHYEYVYWVDFRYTDETVTHMVDTYGVQEVLFETATFNATGGLCNDLFLRIGQ